MNLEELDKNLVLGEDSVKISAIGLPLYTRNLHGKN